MEKPIYEECHFLNIGQCPNQFLLQKALLIPQLLDPPELAEVIEHSDLKEDAHILHEK